MTRRQRPNQPRTSRNMRTRLLIAALLTVILGAVAWLVLNRSESEPVYQGRRLSDWLEDFDHWNGDTNAPVVVAIRALGTNAIPTVVKMSLWRDSRLKDKVSIEFEKHPNLMRYRYTIAAMRWSRAGHALNVMGETARAAVPYYLQALTNRDAVTRRGALNALGYIGPLAEDSIPTLLARQDDLEALGNLLRTLGDIGRRADLCVPVLIQGLGNTNDSVRSCAAHALGRFGDEAKAAIPSLTQALSDKETAWEAARALKKIQSGEP
jgi:hypothetical protein